MTSSVAVAVPSFTGLRAPSCSPKPKVSAASPSAKVASPIKASFKDMGVVVAATAASAMLLGNAMATEEVLSHNVVLEEDTAGGVEVGKKSMREEGYQKAGEGRYSMWVDENFDCAAPPPQGQPPTDGKEMQRKLLARLMMPW